MKLVLLILIMLPFSMTAMNDLEKLPFEKLTGIESPDYQVIDTTAGVIWEKYVKVMSKDKKRLEEHKKSEIRFGGKIMRYSMKKIGESDADGIPLYIALHGGGGAPKKINDSQWNHMKIYYKDSIKKGIYVAPRGITNTWNLHFVNESYIMYDRLIENMILFEGVDPNRVYIMGFSAGGDAVYQLAPKMADRWAAASMSAGHHNNVSPRNLYNLPFLIQVGARDHAHKRHHAAVNYAEKIQKLKDQEKSGYPYNINVHYMRGHNFLDNHPEEPLQKVFKDPFTWKTSGKSEIKEINTNAVAWLKKHKRNPLPKRVIWDLKTAIDRSAPELWKSSARGKRLYWLGIDKMQPGEIIASYDRGSNTVKVEKGVPGMIIYLNQQMLNLYTEVKFDIEGTTLNITPQCTVKNLAVTALERGDPNLMFEAAVKLTKENDKWVIKDL